ncbi:hypothetical protein TIFTF001_053856, partial [Ficus carica]
GDNGWIRPVASSKGLVALAGTELGRDRTGLDWTGRRPDWSRFGWKREHWTGTGLRPDWSGLDWAETGLVSIRLEPCGHWTGTGLGRDRTGLNSAGTVRALAGQQQWWNGQWLKWWCGVAARLGSLARRRGRNWAVSAAGDGRQQWVFDGAT